MFRDLGKYLIKKWYILLLVCVVMFFGLGYFQRRVYGWDETVMSIQQTVNFIIGIMGGSYVVIAMFAWIKNNSTGDKK